MNLKCYYYNLLVFFGALIISQIIFRQFMSVWDIYFVMMFSEIFERGCGRDFKTESYHM